MAAVPPPPPPHYNDHDHHHHHQHKHQHSPHLDPSTRRMGGLSCSSALAAGAGGGGRLLATPASDDDDPGDLSGFSGNHPTSNPSLRIAKHQSLSQRQCQRHTKQAKRADAAAAVAFLSSIAFTNPNPSPDQPQPQPQPQTRTLTSEQDPVAVAVPVPVPVPYHGASPTLAASGTGWDTQSQSQSLTWIRSPRDRAAISFLSAIDFGTPSTQVPVAATRPPASFASSSDQSSTPTIAIGTAGTGGTLDNTPVLLPAALVLTPVLASPRTFRSALASPRLSAAAAARSVRRKFRHAVHLSTAFSKPSSSSSANSSSNPTTLARPDPNQSFTSADPHPLSIDTTPTALLASPSSALGPSPRGRAPSLLSASYAAHASSPYPLPLSASDPPRYTSAPLRSSSGPRRSAYLARPSSLPVVWSSLFPFDRRTALPPAPSSSAAPPPTAHSTTALTGRAGLPTAGGDSLASLALTTDAPAVASSSTTPVVVGMVAVVVAAALDKAGRRTLGGSGRPAVSFASMLAPTGALCSESERRAAAAMVVDASAALATTSVTGGVLAAVSIVSVDDKHDDTVMAQPAHAPLPQSDVVCDFMLARAQACLCMIAGTERDAACSRRASDGSARASLDGIGIGSSAERTRDRNDVVRLVHASLVDELDQQQHYQSVLPATGAATMAGADAGAGAGGDSAAAADTAIAKPPRGTTLLQVMYDAAQLDDPALTTGRHKTVISLPGMMGSILQYTRPSELKKELNGKFRQTHPEVDPSLTLSQIRNLKRRLIDVGNHFNLEVSSLAKAFVYFEKLVLKRAVIKSNRRLVGAICLLLACKVNEPKETLSIGLLLEALAKTLGKVTVKDMHDNEFAVFAQLEFNLYLPQHEFMPHFERICAIKDISSLQDYIS